MARDACGRPRLSVVICIHDMPREAPRTILSATVPYQRDIAVGEVEVVVVDNGSHEKLPPAVIADLPAEVVVVDAPNPEPSPAAAMNWAARDVARGEFLLLGIDGARIFSDRLCASALAVHELVGEAFVYTLAWHLGPDVQMISSAKGYDEATEDLLLARSGWPARPSALFEISVLAGSSRPGFFRPISESNAVSMSRDLFERVGGFDERFTSPGGGLCNLELFGRYVTRPGARNVCLLSEGTFHQVHGGVATSRKRSWATFQAEHRQIFGRDWVRPTYATQYYGAVRPEARRFFVQSLETAVEDRDQQPSAADALQSAASGSGSTCTASVSESSEAGQPLQNHPGRS